MLARIAQELFWLGRDLDARRAHRAHARRRLPRRCRRHTGRARGRAQLGGRAGDHRRQATRPGRGGLGPGRRTRGAVEFAAGPAASDVARLLTLDTDSPASIVSCVARARERGRTPARRDLDRDVGGAQHLPPVARALRPRRRRSTTGPYSVYQEVKERCALFWGLVERTMLRDEGRSFLEAGGRIEDADMVLRMLRVAIPPGPLAGRRPATRARRSPCCTRSAAFRPTDGPTRTRPTLGAGRPLPALRRCLPGLGRLVGRGAPRRALGRRRPAALLPAGAAPRPADRRSRASAARPGPRRRAHETLAQVQDELELVDRDIDERYFAIAASLRSICRRRHDAGPR